MATKLKKHNPFLAFFVYGLSLSVFLGIAAVLILNIGSVKLDYKQTSIYRYNRIPRLLQAGYDYAAGDGFYSGGIIYAGNGEARVDDPEEIEPNAQYRNGSQQAAEQVLAGEGGNIAYLIYGKSGSLSSGTGAVTADAFIQEAEGELAASRENFHFFSVRSSSKGYDHLLVLRGGDLYEVINTRTGETRRQTTIAMSPYSAGFDEGTLNALNQLSAEDVTICLAVRAEGAFTSNYGTIYNAYYLWYQSMVTVLALAGAALVSLIVFLAVRLKRQSLDIAGAKLAAFTGWFWIECKAAAALAGLIVMFLVLDAGGGFWLESVVLLFIDFWMFWMLINDLRRNGREVFRHNIANSVRRLVTKFDSRYPFCARMKRRLLYLILAGLCLLFLALLLLLLFEEMGVVLDIFLALAGVFLVVCYVINYYRDVDVLADIVDYVSAIRAGEALTPLSVPSESAFAPMAANLNDIHSGMTRMVEERVRSERMKVELITNVSHDLKTPLTSIINYIDLLGKEALTPDYANDYVKVLEGKAERLKNLVQDLFEISKANSGAIDLNLEQLCVQSLVEQTVAELDQKSVQAGVEIKLQLCDTPLNVRADGKKLHRVFENLLGNALKYSLTGTRVYIAVTQEGGEVQIAFKNVAGYEMTFTAEEIVERFQRGDASRTTEGSGLGLAIAKSFLELNGGSLRIELDGDLFKAIVRLPLYVPYDQRSAVQESGPEAPVEAQGSGAEASAQPPASQTEQAQVQPAQEARMEPAEPSGTAETESAKTGISLEKAASPLPEEPEKNQS